jgi:hypothetical protein
MVVQYERYEQRALRVPKNAVDAAAHLGGYDAKIMTRRRRSAGRTREMLSARFALEGELRTRRGPDSPQPSPRRLAVPVGVKRLLIAPLP